MKFLNLDSPFMRGLNKVADILWLNILTLLLCIPVITAGASFTAMHFVLLKLLRDEEGYISKDFFRSFKENFGQATIIWLIELTVGAILVCDCWLYFTGQLSFADDGSPLKTVVVAAFIISSILFLFVSSLVFPVLSHFINTTGKTIKNAFYMSILQLPKTVLMILLNAVPYAIIIFVPQIMPLAFLFMFAGPGYGCAALYNKTFKRFEPEPEKPADDMEWSISADETDGENNEDSDIIQEDDNGNVSENDKGESFDE